MMIKTREDMRGCYAERADTEVFELFMDKCEELGIRWINGEESKSRKWFSYVIFSGAFYDSLSGSYDEHCASRRYRKLTKEDFIEESKMKIRVEYAPITASIFDLKDDFEAGRIFRKLQGGDLPWHIASVRIASEVELARAISSGEAYLRTDRAITWYEECQKHLVDNCKNLTESCDLSLCISEPISDDEDDLKEWKELQREFIELCKIVAKAHE